MHNASNVTANHIWYGDLALHGHYTLKQRPSATLGMVLLLEHVWVDGTPGPEIWCKLPKRKAFV